MNSKGGNYGTIRKSKTDEERAFEDEEQMNYLRNYKNGGKTKNE